MNEKNSEIIDAKKIKKKFLPRNICWRNDTIFFGTLWIGTPINPTSRFELLKDIMSQKKRELFYMDSNFSLEKLHHDQFVLTYCATPVS